jgi:hypothetical protein
MASDASVSPAEIGLAGSPPYPLPPVTSIPINDDGSHGSSPRQLTPRLCPGLLAAGRLSIKDGAEVEGGGRRFIIMGVTREFGLYSTLSVDVEAAAAITNRPLLG